MNHCIKEYWPTKDGFLLTVHKPAPEEIDTLKQSAVRCEDKEWPYYQLPNGQVLLEGGVLFESVTDLEKFWGIGLGDHNAYSTFNPDGYDFLANRYKYIKQLIEGFALDPARMNYSEESLQYLTLYLMEHYQGKDWEIEKQLLGLLAYCGETYLKQVQGKWYLAGPRRRDPVLFLQYRAAASPDIDFPPESGPLMEIKLPYKHIEADYSRSKYYWYPFIELPSGKLKNVFEYFFDGLIECALPAIILQTQTTLKEESKEDHPPFISPGDPGPVTWDVHVIAVNKADIDVMLANNPPVRLAEATLPADQTIYQLEDGKLLTVTKDHTNGKLFDSEAYFYQDSSKAE